MTSRSIRHGGGDERSQQLGGGYAARPAYQASVGALRLRAGTNEDSSQFMPGTFMGPSAAAAGAPAAGARGPPDPRVGADVTYSVRFAGTQGAVGSSNPGPDTGVARSMSLAGGRTDISELKTANPSLWHGMPMAGPGYTGSTSAVGIPQWQILEASRRMQAMYVEAGAGRYPLAAPGMAGARGMPPWQPPATAATWRGGIVPAGVELEEPSPSKEMAIPDSIAVSRAFSNVSSNSSKGKEGSIEKSLTNAVSGSPHVSSGSGAGGTGSGTNSPSVTGAMGRLTVSSTGSSHSETGANEPLSEDGSLGCRRFTMEQLRAATDNFSPSNFISRGSHDAVFRGKLMGCKVAVKRLEGGGWQGPIEYRTEVEVLSRMRHPHIVLLMGHCPEEHCLVYEYLPGGSLQNYLSQTPGVRPLRWFDRVRILCEVVNALLFLHQHEPPIVHRDLNPGNILIDAKLSCKLGDVGLARLVKDDDSVTAGPKGTPGYIDPEEITTLEVSLLGDVYAFGLIGLQVLMGEPSITKLQKMLGEASTMKGRGGAMSRLADMVMGKLDTLAGEWPADMARQMVVMLLRCADAKRDRRPDLAEEVLPVVQKAAERAALEVQRKQDGLEAQLICPLTQVRMTDPVVAADGFTYERAAIEQWLLQSTASPTTGQVMEHKFLTPNNGVAQLLMLGN